MRKKNLKYRQTLINILAKQKGLTQLNKKVGKIFVCNFAFGTWSKSTSCYIIIHITRFLTAIKLNQINIIVLMES